MMIRARGLSIIALLVAGCADPESIVTVEESVTATTTENFETGTKTGYAAANVALASGTWNLDDALLGTLSGDAKAGTQSARMRNAGRVTMLFDRTSGAGTVTVRHGTFGSDGSGTFGLFWSQNGGSSWTQTGQAITANGNSLSTTQFTVNRSGTIRFQFRKLDGGVNRINLDDIAITDFASSPPGESISIHTALGLPSPASTSNANSFLSVKGGYVISYNSGRKIPNWVSWELNGSYLGSAARQDTFRRDNTLPSTLPQAELTDYSGSGFDRGHMCPSGDRTLTVAGNSETFFLTNMVPQAANNNRGPWEKLESYCRSLLSQGKELFIISGGVVASSSDTIGTGVAVPDETFKVIVVLDSPGDGRGEVTTSTRVIGVLMPNDNSQISQADDWRPFRVSVRTIENLTHYNFLSDVAQSVQDVVESRVDNQP
jgi:endonuclease G